MSTQDCGENLTPEMLNVFARSFRMVPLLPVVASLHISIGWIIFKPILFQKSFLQLLDDILIFFKDPEWCRQAISFWIQYGDNH